MTRAYFQTMTASSITEAIRADYNRVLGKVIFPLEVDGYIDGDSVVVTTLGMHPFEVLTTAATDLQRPMGEGCWDPCWDVRPLYPDEFQQLVRETFPYTTAELASMWVYGHSYREGSTAVLRSKLRFGDTFLMGNNIR